MVIPSISCKQIRCNHGFDSSLDHMSEPVVSLTTFGTDNFCELSTILINISSYFTGAALRRLFATLESYSLGNLHKQNKQCILKSNLTPLLSTTASGLNCLESLASLCSSSLLQIYQ